MKCFNLTNGTLQSTHDVMVDFTAHKSTYVRTLLESEGRRHVAICSACHGELGDGPVYSCDDCFGKPQLCKDCAVSGHRLQPFHRIKAWTGLCFDNARLADIGLHLHLGHEGWPCPVSSAVSSDGAHPQDHHQTEAPPADGRGRNSKDITVAHSNGYHIVNMIPCKCPKSRPVWEQMLRRGLWPATFGYPETAFTTECLQLGRNLHLECQSSISAFHSLLESMTALPYHILVPVSGESLHERTLLNVSQNKVSELTRCLRQFRVCQTEIIFGFGYTLAPPTQGEMVWRCGCCAHEGVNTPPGWEADPCKSVVSTTVSCRP